MPTEGQHRPKAGKKKKTREAGLFFLVPTSQVMLHLKWEKKPFPDWKRGVYRQWSSKSKLYVDRRRSPGLGVFSGEGGSKLITTYPVQIR